MAFFLVLRRNMPKVAQEAGGGILSKGVSENIQGKNFLCVIPKSIKRRGKKVFYRKCRRKRVKA